MLVAYVSGHGFGHATRVAEVLRAVRARSPSLAITVVSSAPEDLFRRAIPGPLAFRTLECDVGLVQQDALTIDEGETLVRWRAFQADNGDRIDAEWRWLRHAKTRVVLGDVPPLAFEAAAEAGIPSVALANFSWDWVYRHFSRRRAGLGTAASAAAAAYARCGLLLKLPFAGDLTAFRKVVEIPLVARRPRVPRAEVRRRLGLGAGPIALVSFGGIGLPGFDPGVLGGVLDVEFVTVGPMRPSPSNVRIFEDTALKAFGLGFEDLVGGADVVVTKPGYGIVTDAIGAGTRIVYTERGDFPEYEILVAGMQAVLPCAHVSNADLLAGRLGAPIRSVLEHPVPPPPDLSGASVAAEQLLALAS
jgi:hypothetical protein